MRFQTRIPPAPWARGLLAGIAGTACALFIQSLSVVGNVELELSLTTPDTPEIFYTFGRDGYHPSRSTTWIHSGEGLQTFTLSRRGLRQPSLIRIDPMTRPGEFELASVTVAGPGGSVKLQGETLFAQMRRPHQISLKSTADQPPVFVSGGEDPHFSIPVPKNVLSMPWSARWPQLLLVFLTVSASWAVAERLHKRRRRRDTSQSAPLVHTAPVRWTLIVAACAGMTYDASFQITDDPVQGDGVQNLAVAYNLLEYRVFSHLFDPASQPMLDAAPKPTNYREPVPPLVTSAFLAVHALGGERFSLDDLVGEKSRTVKYSNLFWVFFGLLAVWLLAHRLTNSHASAGLLTFVIYYFTYHQSSVIDTLYTELPAMTLLVWTTYLLVAAANAPSAARFFAAGLMLGVLALTKSVFVLVAPVAVLLLALALFMEPRVSRSQAARHAANALVIIIGMATVISPWIVRNIHTVGVAETSGRSGILYGRAVLNDIDIEEVKGVLYLYGPELYRRAVAGTSFAEQAGDTQRDGRWARLNRGASDFFWDDRAAMHAGDPTRTISIHHTVIAEYVARIRELEMEGHPDPELAAESEFRRMGMKRILANPGRHLAMSFLAFWRGFWSFPDVDLPGVPVSLQKPVIETLNLLAGATLLFAFIVGLFRRDPALTALTVFPVGMMTVYALICHNIPRYSVPAHPIMLLLFASVLLTAIKTAYCSVRSCSAGQSALNPEHYGKLKRSPRREP